MESADFINAINGTVQYYAVNKDNPDIAIAAFKAVDSAEHVYLWGCWIDIETHNSVYSNVEILKSELYKYSLQSKWPGV